MLKSKALFRRLGLMAALLSALSCSRNEPDPADMHGGSPDMVISKELSNKRATAFGEDEKGHVWIGTFRGLNRFDVHDYHQYFCSDDPSSINDNQINDIFRDSGGQLWIATINGVCRYTDRDNFERVDMQAEDRCVYQIFESNDRRLFFRTSDDIYEYLPDSGTVELRIPRTGMAGSQNHRCIIDKSNSLWIAGFRDLKRYSLDNFRLQGRTDIGETATAYLPDPAHNRLWIAVYGGVRLFDFMSETFRPLPDNVAHNPALAAETVTLLHPYDNSSLLLNTFDHGLMLLDITTGSILRHDDNGFPFESPESVVYHMFTDSQNNLWIGSYDQGVSVTYNRKGHFINNRYIHSLTRGKSIMCTDVDADGNLWISTMLDGLYVYNPATHAARHIGIPAEIKTTKAFAQGISSMEVDMDNNIWLGSLFAGKLIKCRYDGHGLRVLKSFDMDMPHMLNADEYGHIWAGTASDKLYCIDIRSNEMRSASLNAEGGCFISGIQPMDSGTVLVIALKQPLMEVDISTMEARPADVPVDQWKECLRRSFFIPTDICKDSFGEVWIGTVGNGVLRYSPAEHSVTRVEGASCTDISSIIEDRQGNIWISSQYGLSKYDRTSGKHVHYYEVDGTGGNQYYDRASCLMPDGVVVFGGTHGLTAFNPIDVGGSREVPLVFEDLKIHNQLINPGLNPGIIEKHLSYSPRITLNYKQNGFSISFAALDYYQQERPHYLFMLEGHDKYWIDGGSNNECYYANLPSGQYTFRVKITNDNGSVVAKEIALPISIRPAPWLTWWAQLLYALIIIAALAMALRIRQKMIRNEMLATQAIYEKEQEKRINRMNMSFFANIAHEFRTPLTMISGPLEQLSMSTAVKGADREILSIIRRSVARMLRLVNQLMDFNKLENDTLKLQVERADAVAYLKSSIDIFKVNAANKDIGFVTDGLEGNFICLLDPDKLDKIVNNLLSNALKFTPTGGKISLSFDVVPGSEAAEAMAASTFRGQKALDAASYIKIVVEDSGPGIPEDRREKVFERYYQLSDADRGKYNWGTGIGLYYARALAALHHGALFVQPRPDDMPGSAFVLLLPATDESYSSDEHVLPAPKIAMEGSSSPLPEPETPAATPEEGTEKPLILIVEDDVEVIHYLKTLLSSSYRVIGAYNAESGLEIAAEHHPNLIISDVVMPGVDGYEFCRRVKNDVQLCHLPVILVTAQADINSQIQGLNTGADAYVTKPFDTKYLFALISSLLSNRSKLQHILNESTQVGKIEADMISGPDKVFMDELYTLMEKEISNSELDIMHITEMMHISRTKFYYKVKELTGHSPATFFKTYKLNRAAELIREGRYNVSEIADLTGFSTHAHFTTSFKKHFGVTPTAYAESGQ